MKEVFKVLILHSFVSQDHKCLKQQSKISLLQNSYN